MSQDSLSPLDQTKTPAWLLGLGPYATIVLSASILLLVWFGALLFVQNEKRQIERSASITASNLARAFQEQITSVIHNVDMTLLYIRQEYARDPEQFDLQLWQNHKLFLNSVTFQVAIIDPAGTMIKSNIQGSTPGLHLGDREHFRVHVDNPSDELFISKPVFGRVSGKWSIQFTRKVILLDGSFGGVIVVSVDPQYLSQFYRSIDIGKLGAVALIGNDGVVRARATSESSSIAGTVASSQMLSLARQKNAGEYKAFSAIDSVERFFVYRRVTDHPLIVTVGLATSELFAPLDETAWWTYLFAGGITIWLISMSIITLLYQKYLSKTTIEANAGLRSRSQFLAMISHEMRTPLNGVNGMSELLSLTSLTETQALYVKTLQRSAKHLLALINNVLDFSKIEAGHISLNLEPVDIRELIAHCKDIVSSDADEKGIAIEIYISPGTPKFLMCDPSRLSQVLLNLLGNAVKFTHTGSIRLNCSVQPEKTGYCVTISMRDTGIGISKEALPKLFNEFMQADGSISRKFGGTGLGLAISKRIVSLMGGAISVSSEEGVGTEVTVNFVGGDCQNVITDFDQMENQIKNENVDNKDLSINILVVDDDPTNQLVASKLLEKMGHRVTLASSGEEAIHVFDRQRFELVFMDMMMPEMDGLVTTRKIRKIEQKCVYGEPSYIIALTANTRIQDKLSCLSAGMNEFAFKPITRSALRKSIEKYLSRKHEDSSEAATITEGNCGIQENNGALEEIIEEFGVDSAKSVFQSFIDSMESRLDAIHAGLANGDRAEIVRQAHSAKGACGTMGLANCAASFASIEVQAIEVTKAQLDKMCSIARNEYEIGKISLLWHLSRVRLTTNCSKKGA